MAKLVPEVQLLDGAYDGKPGGRRQRLTDWVQCFGICVPVLLPRRTVGIHAGDCMAGKAIPWQDLGSLQHDVLQASSSVPQPKLPEVSVQILWSTWWGPYFSSIDTLFPDQMNKAHYLKLDLTGMLNQYGCMAEEFLLVFGTNSKGVSFLPEFMIVTAPLLSQCTRTDSWRQCKIHSVYAMIIDITSFRVIPFSFTSWRTSI